MKLMGHSSGGRSAVLGKESLKVFGSDRRQLSHSEVRRNYNSQGDEAMKLMGHSSGVAGVAADNTEWLGVKGGRAKNICKTVLAFALLCSCIGPPVDAGVVGAVGDLYVTSDVNSIVIQYDGTTGALVGTFASGGLDGAADLVFTPNGKLLVTGYRSHNVVEYDGTTGAFVREFASSDDGLDNPVGLALGHNGNLLVGNGCGENVLEFDVTTGALIGVFASTGRQGFIEDILIGPNGNLFVTSAAAPIIHEVLEYDGTTGAFIRVFAGSGIFHPAGLVFRPNGNLLVASHPINEVSQFNGTTGAPMGVFATVFRPVDMAYGSNGNLLVAVDFRFRVDEFDENNGAFIRTFASSAGLNRPYHLVFKPVFDSDGDGVNDADDACPDTDLSDTIVIDGEDTGVENCQLGDGCSLSDLITEILANDPATADVVQMLVDLTAAGLLSGQEMGAILHAINSP